jgi:thiamine pyrophosphokinase
MVVSSEGWVSLLGAAAVSSQDIDEVLAIAPTLVDADGGAEAALRAGHMPHAVIGDLYSLSHTARKRISAEKIVHVSEQETTDFEKCLSRIEAPLIVAAGFAGGRVDHELAVYSVLVRNADRPCIVLGAEDLVFAAPSRLALDLSPGTRVSLFPMAQVTGRSDGLEWPIEGLAFAPDGRIGTSNRANGKVELVFDGPGMLVILPRTEFDVAARALTSG